MAAPEITVRMYKGILGDCFLLKLKQGSKRAHILIDCGILQNVKDEAKTITCVAEDIAISCGYRPAQAGGQPHPGMLDLLVVTHEHWDHISGFSHGRDWFFDPAKLEIGKLWVAWTEQDSDGQVQQLRKKFDKQKRAILGAVDSLGRRMTRLGLKDETGAPMVPVDGLGDFIGPIGDLLGAKERWTGRKIMDKLKAHVGDGNIDYLEPGTVHATPGAVKLRAYVLGPPRSEERLYHDLPRGKGADKESYLKAATTMAEAVASSLSLAEGGSADEAPDSPFSGRHRRLTAARLPEARAEDAALNAVLDRYEAKGEAYRQIGSDWTESAGALALKLDSDTNNGSLVLALEPFEGSGVLLFAADAQVGNWLSWHDQPYPKKAEDAAAKPADMPGGKQVSAAELLARTIVYKVGHHASHNATLRKDGLELMTHPELVALIPVVQAVAATRKGWHMPYPPLLKRLEEKAIVLRGDDGARAGASQPVSPTVAARITPHPKTGTAIAVDYRVKLGA